MSTTTTLILYPVNRLATSTLATIWRPVTDIAGIDLAKPVRASTTPFVISDDVADWADLAFHDHPPERSGELLAQGKLLSFAESYGQLFRAIDESLAETPLTKYSSMGGYVGLRLMVGYHTWDFGWREEIEDPGIKHLDTDLSLYMFGYGLPRDWPRYFAAARSSRVLMDVREQLRPLVGETAIEADFGY